MVQMHYLALPQNSFATFLPIDTISEVFLQCSLIVFYFMIPERLDIKFRDVISFLISKMIETY